MTTYVKRPAYENTERLIQAGRRGMVPDPDQPIIKSDADKAILPADVETVGDLGEYLGRLIAAFKAYDEMLAQARTLDAIEDLIVSAQKTAVKGGAYIPTSNPGRYIQAFFKTYTTRKVQNVTREQVFKLVWALIKDPSLWDSVPVSLFKKAGVNVDCSESYNRTVQLNDCTPNDNKKE